MRGDVDESRRRAAVEVSRHCRLSGAVRLLDDLASAMPLSDADHQFYFMAWRTVCMLRPHPGDLAAGRSRPLSTA